MNEREQLPGEVRPPAQPWPYKPGLIYGGKDGVQYVCQVDGSLKRREEKLNKRERRRLRRSSDAHQ